MNFSNSSCWISSTLIKSKSFRLSFIDYGVTLGLITLFVVAMLPPPIDSFDIFPPNLLSGVIN